MGLQKGKAFCLWLVRSTIYIDQRKHIFLQDCQSRNRSVGAENSSIQALHSVLLNMPEVTVGRFRLVCFRD